MEGYLNYLSFDENEHNVHVVSQSPRFWVYSLFWGVAFCAMYPMYNVLCREMFPRFYAKVAVGKREELVSYLVCLTHHSVVILIALNYLYLDYMRGPDGLRTVNYAVEYGWFVPWICGYFIADTIMYAIPRAFEGNYEFLFHHVLGLGLIVCAVFIKSGAILKLCPHMLICELSSCIFSIAYLLRLHGHRGSSILTVLELSFAVSFMLTRNVNMSLIIWSVRGVMQAEYMSCWVIILMVLALQFYWLYKIIMSQVRKKKSKGDAQKTQ